MRRCTMQEKSVLGVKFTLPTDTDKFIDVMFTDVPDGAKVLYHKRPKDTPKTAGWYVIPDKMTVAMREGEQAAVYVSATTHYADENGDYRRLGKTLAVQHYVGLDDIGTKVDAPKLKPTAIIETSKGNFQYFYKFTVPVANPIAYQITNAIYDDPKLTDQGGKMPNKILRLPHGLNNKDREDGYDDFPVRLIELNEGISYAPEELIKEWDLVLGTKSRTHTKNNLVGRVDPLLTFFDDSGMLLGGGSDGYVDIKCLFSDSHTDPDDIKAGYKPVGNTWGDLPAESRHFKCWHDSCKERKQHEYMTALRDLKYFPWHYSAEVEFNLLTQCLVGGKIMADMTATGATRKSEHKLQEWKNMNGQQVKIDGDGNYKSVASQVVSNRHLLKAQDTIFRPSQNPDTLIDVNGQNFYNTYKKPFHKATDERPDVFLDHIDYLYPSKEERETFLNWVAYKVQYPGSRSYAWVNVADAGLTEGDTYGIGRTVVATIIQQVMQSGVLTMDFKKFAGKSSDFTGWANGALLIVINEAKDKGDYQERKHTYETIKFWVDSSPLYNVLLQFKFGGETPSDVFFIMIINTNHANALILEEGDRRLAVATNPTVKRTRAEYAAVHALVGNDDEIAKIYWYFMNRDVSEFDPTMPPMWPAKELMIELSDSPVDDAVLESYRDLPGDLVTKDQFVEDCVMRAGLTGKHDGHKQKSATIHKAELSRKRLDKIEQGSPKSGRIWHNEQSYHVRILRNTDKWRELFKDTKQNRNDIVAEVLKNRQGIVQIHNDALAKKEAEKGK